MKNVKEESLTQTRKENEMDSIELSLRYKQDSSNFEFEEKRKVEIVREDFLQKRCRKIYSCRNKRQNNYVYKMKLLLFVK